MSSPPEAGSIEPHVGQTGQDYTKDRENVKERQADFLSHQPKSMVSTLAKDT